MSVIFHVWFLFLILIIVMLVTIKLFKGKNGKEDQILKAGGYGIKPTTPQVNDLSISTDSITTIDVTAEPKTQISLSNNDICGRCGGALHPVTIMNGELKGFTILMCQHITCKGNERALASAKKVKRQQLKTNALKDRSKLVTDKRCPECGSGLSVKKGRRGKLSGTTFWGCDHFPKCRHYEIITSRPKRDEDKLTLVTNKQCPECGSGLSVRRGRRGKLSGINFLGCDHFPKCRHYEIIE